MPFTRFFFFDDRVIKFFVNENVFVSEKNKIMCAISYAEYWVKVVQNVKPSRRVYLCKNDGGH